MFNFNHSYRLALQHSLAWIAFIIYEQLVFMLVGSPAPSISGLLINYTFNAILFYLNCQFLLPKFAEKKRYLIYIFLSLVCLLLFSVGRSSFFIYTTPAAKLAKSAAYGRSILNANAFIYYTVQSFSRGVYFYFLSVGYWFARRTVQVEIQKRRQEEELRVAERNLLQAELAFLKGQINPHFLFNSLNFLYAQVYPHSENAARGILLLSDTMRYALHEESGGKVMLAEEVKYLRNYVALNQLRFNNQLKVELEITGHLQFAMILPLVLITFVENCFKHGELGDETSPLAISLNLVRNQLTFRTHNKKRNGPKEKSTGIGLANTRKRLDLVYGQRYALTVRDDPDSYTCHLVIDL